MSNLSNISSIDTAEDLWYFLMSSGMNFKLKQFHYLAFGINPPPKSSLYIKKSSVNLILEENPFEKKYNNFYLPKRTGGFRIIREPCPVLKAIQSEILRKILKPYSETILKENCTGFRAGLSIIDNASYHLNKRMIIKLDIANFFPSISQARIYGIFSKKVGFNHQLSSYLSGLCTYKNELPQGSPTSPVLANLIASRIDDRVLMLLKKLNKNNPTLNLSYSRYADDLTLSYNDTKLSKSNLINLIQEIIEDEGFDINLKKIRAIPSSQKQLVTGIVVNGITPSMGRQTYRYFRLIAHSIRSLGWDVALMKWNQSNSKQIENVDKFKEVIKGYLNYFLMVNRNSIYLHQMKNLFTDQI